LHDSPSPIQRLLAKLHLRIPRLSQREIIRTIAADFETHNRHTHKGGEMKETLYERQLRQAREYYWRNREKVLAYKKGYYAVNGDKCRARTDRYRNSEQGKMKRIEHTLRQMAQ